MANFHNNYLAIAAKETEMVQLLELMRENLERNDGGIGVDSAQPDAVTSVRGLFDSISDTLEWRYCDAFRPSPSVRAMSDTAIVSLTCQGDAWVLTMDYDTANSSNEIDVKDFFCMMPEGVGDFGLALFESDECDDYESVRAESWQLEVGKDPRVDENYKHMYGPYYYRSHRTSWYKSFSPEALLEERQRLAESPSTATTLVEIADRAALRGWAPDGPVGKVSADSGVIRSGAGFVDEQGFAYVPEGTVEVCEDAYDSDHLSVSGGSRGLRPLPDTLRVLGERAFSGVVDTPMYWDSSTTKKVRAVVEVPRSVERFGTGAFYGFDKVVVYDSIDADKVVVDEDVWQRACHQIPEALSQTSNIGRANIRGRLGVSKILYWHPFEVEVRSAQTGEVRYRVWMPVNDFSKDPWELATVWGRGASVYFPGLDAAFDKYKDVGIATLRLRWPEQLPDEARAKYEGFIKNGAGAKLAAQILIADDDAEGLAILEPLGILRKTNIDELVEYAETGFSRMGRVVGDVDYNALERDGDGDARPACASYLREYRDAHFPKRGGTRCRRKPLAKAFRDAAEGIKRGDTSGLAELEGRRSLASCNPVVVVEMLDNAAALGDPSTVEKIYELFGRPEYESRALAIAIAMGNEQVALALCKHGATLNGGINPITYSKDSADSAEKRVRQHYGSGGRHWAIMHMQVRLRGRLRDYRWDEATERCVRTLVAEGFLTPSDLKIMLLEALSSGYFDSVTKGGLDAAEALLALGADEDAEGSIVEHGETITSAMGFLDLPEYYPHAVAYVFRHHEDEIASWRPSYGELRYWGNVGAIARDLFPHLGPENFRGYEVPLLISFGSAGWFEELATILSWDGFLTAEMLDECVSYFEGWIGKGDRDAEALRDYFAAERERRDQEA